MKIRILNYHRVGQGPAYLPRVRFAEQMACLSALGYHTLSLAQLVQGNYGPSERHVVLTFDDGYRQTWENAIPILKEKGFAGAFFVIGGLIGGRFRGEEMMSWGEILELEKMGMELGSHTLSHPRLTRLWQEEARREIALSKALLEEKAQRRVDFFCYPFGDVNTRIRGLVKECGYLGACTIRPGLHRDHLDPYRLRRTNIWPWENLTSFQWKIAGVYDLPYLGYYYCRRSLACLQGFSRGKDL